MEPVTKPADVSFACGAILAVAAEIARRASGDTAEASVRRKYAAAVDHPRLTFGPLIRTATLQLAQISSEPHKVAHFKIRIADLCGQIGDEFPSQKLDEGRFGIGYYQELDAIRQASARRLEQFARQGAPAVPSDH